MATAFYLQTGYIHPLIHWLSLPIALTIFNVILLNEFPDYAADLAVGKKNLLVRLGRKRGLLLYGATSVALWPAMGMAVRAGVSGKVWFIYLPTLILSALILWLIYRKWHEKPRTLEMLCGMNIAVNLGTTCSLFLALS